MKLTRKHLNQVLLSLPHPSLVLQGKVDPYIMVPVYKMMSPIMEDHFKPSDTIDRHEVTFEFDFSEMDWVLKYLEV